MIYTCIYTEFWKFHIHCIYTYIHTFFKFHIQCIYTVYIGVYIIFYIYTFLYIWYIQKIVYIIYTYRHPRLENFNKRLFLEGKVLSYNIKISESKANFAKVLPPWQRRVTRRSKSKPSTTATCSRLSGLRSKKV